MRTFTQQKKATVTSARATKKSNKPSAWTKLPDGKRALKSLLTMQINHC